MSSIKIPSKNIFNLNHTKLIKNKIERVDYNEYLDYNIGNNEKFNVKPNINNENDRLNNYNNIYTGIPLSIKFKREQGINPDDKYTYKVFINNKEFSSIIQVQHSYSSSKKIIDIHTEEPFCLTDLDINCNDILTAYQYHNVTLTDKDGNTYPLPPPEEGVPAYMQTMGDLYGNNYVPSMRPPNVIDLKFYVTNNSNILDDDFLDKESNYVQEYKMGEYGKFVLIKNEKTNEVGFRTTFNYKLWQDPQYWVTDIMLINIYFREERTLQKAISYPSNINAKNNNIFSLNSNSLLREKMYYNNTSIGEVISENIIQEYKNGKETAKILCDFDDYYEDGTNKLIISLDDETKQPTFKLGDIVTPYVIDSYGNEKPLSINKTTNTPKNYNVVGVKIINDGNLLQELTLLEK